MMTQIEFYRYFERKRERLLPVLAEVNRFLREHHQYNGWIQHVYYKRALLPWRTTDEKLLALLHHAWSTQTRGNLDNSRATWQAFEQVRSEFQAITDLNSLQRALSIVGYKISKEVTAPVRPTNLEPLHAIWCTLTLLPGFGPKTAAIFVKSLVDIHLSDENEFLRFMPNFALTENDKLFVPVDGVIEFVFRYLTRRTFNFHQINELLSLSGYCHHSSALLWDDLWFWGFITQRGGGDDRKLLLNDAKFWSLLAAPKSRHSEVMAHAASFVEMLGRLRM